ncbi:septation protein SepH [soil metagenome]
MRTLRFVELAEDGRTLILAPDVPQAIDNGERYELTIDERLRAASRGDISRLGQIEIDVGADLPPREIQSRIRAGESTEQVAAASGMRMERVERYAYPVLQERTRMVEQAHTARVRLRDSQPALPLVEFAAERLAVMGASDSRWDACRSGPNWEIRLAWRAGHKSGTTRWEYDVATRSVSPIDAETSEFAEGTRLVRVVDEGAAGGDDQMPAHDTNPLSVPPITRKGAGRNYRGAPVDVLLGGSGSLPPTTSDDPEGDARAHDPRARIPSWEDIVFGVRRPG